jgi:hypothetical protein
VIFLYFATMRMLFVACACFICFSHARRVQRTSDTELECPSEVTQRLNDPEFVAQLEEKLADPTFQEQARQVLAELKTKRPSKTLASLLFAMSPAGARLGSSARASSVNMEKNADLRALAKQLNPAVGYFDPLNLGSDEGPTSETFIGWMRHAEIKHGRVAMAAFVGYCVTANGFRLPAEPFASITATSPLDQFDALPGITRVNLVLGVGFLEGWGELRGRDVTSEPHYMRGGKPGYYPPFDKMGPSAIYGWYPKLNLWDPFKFTSKLTEEQKATKLIAEINNGRLAMLGLSAFIAEAKVPGSVPLLNGLVPKYEGELVFPPGLRLD